MKRTRSVMTFVGGVLLFYPLVWAAWQKGPVGFHPQRQKLIVACSDDLAVRLERENGHLRVVLQRDQNRIASLSLPQEMAQVDSIEFAAGDKIVVLGHVNGSVRQVVVIDATTRTVIDKFYCYEPILSPDKGFMAFVKFFPAHFAEGVSYQYLFYDFEKSPADNRPPNIPISDPQNVGQVLYPRDATNRPGDNTDQPPSQVHVMASGSFFWSPAGRRVAFADSQSGIVRLVVVEPQGTTPTLRVTERELKKADLCRSQRELGSCAFVVSEIKFTRTGVRVALLPRSGEVKREIAFKLWP